MFYQAMFYQAMFYQAMFYQAMFSSSSSTGLFLAAMKILTLPVLMVLAQASTPLGSPSTPHMEELDAFKGHYHFYRFLVPHGMCS
jgi:hypothetical protein